MTMHDEFDNLFRKMSRSFIDLDTLFEGIVNERGNSISGPMYYGYTLSIGPDGKPVIKEYGNFKPKISPSASPTSHPSTVVGTREPLVDVLVDDKLKQVKLVAEMPGVEKSDVKVVLENKTVHIDAERGEKKYHVTVPIKHKVDKNSAKANYKNGILELVLKQLEPERPKGKTIEVE